MDTGKRLQELRTAKGLSQYRLSQLSGVNQSAISKYERGDRHIGLDALSRIAPILGITVADFLAEDSLAPGEDTSCQKEKPPQDEDALMKALRKVGAIRPDGSIDEERVDLIYNMLRASAPLREEPKNDIG